MRFQNLSILATPPTEDHWKFQGGRVVLKAKLLEEKYEARLECPGSEGGGGVKAGALLVMDIF